VTTSVRFQQNTSLSSWLLIPPNGREYAVSYADIALLSRILPAQDRGAPQHSVYWPFATEAGSVPERPNITSSGYYRQVYSAGHVQLIRIF
jgi:hypothetical protein